MVTSQGDARLNRLLANVFSGSLTNIRQAIFLRVNHKPAYDGSFGFWIDPSWILFYFPLQLFLSVKTLKLLLQNSAKMWVSGRSLIYVALCFAFSGRNPAQILTGDGPISLYSRFLNFHRIPNTQLTSTYVKMISAYFNWLAASWFIIWGLDGFCRLKCLFLVYPDAKKTFSYCIWTSCSPLWLLFFFMRTPFPLQCQRTVNQHAHRYPTEPLLRPTFSITLVVAGYFSHLGGVVHASTPRPRLKCYFWWETSLILQAGVKTSSGRPPHFRQTLTEE